MLRTRNILVDRGNSYCKVTLSDNGVLSEQRLFHKLSQADLVHLCDVSPNTSLRALYCAVGSPEKEVIDFLREHCSFFLYLDEKTEVPLKEIHYQRGQLGADRIALAVGAYDVAPSGHEILVIDIGTAITYERISSEGVYLGGNISPGPLTRSISLHQATAKLPEVTLSPNYAEWGNTTEGAIIAGIMEGILFEIEGYCNRMREKHPQPTILLTGGYAYYFADKLKNVTFVEPNLVMKGLDKLLEYNVQTAQTKK
ncbi:type III pantothenate kinase [Porphyromonas circumdentaria]|uniref:Type III pantothenate kinase n=1 Tax=Porphyromonas circumdentaria TaxID=29524 RepID=A0A1T4PE43_9PORP|nr:type III pantothenate kinase [Porphyromonas circumdentaria]MBB6275691.1 type III pantothenate kinase [Porphyromonas circumdentaria]MDO4723028.1 type III pantothenate kinase [Porphyromonas circumdentaria]SJZ89835.1 type III pantothenate kinase [Porphyromonas circumdentaria]